MAEIQRKKVKKRSQLKALWFQYKKNKLAMFGLILMSLMILTAAVCSGPAPRTGSAPTSTAATCSRASSGAPGSRCSSDSSPSASR